MKVYFDKKVLVGFLLALSILVSLGIYSYRNSQDSVITSSMVSSTNEVLYHIEKLHSIHLEIEAELTRFVITGDTTFAGFYQDEINGAREHYMVLYELIKDNATLSRGLDSIRLLGMEKVDLINHVIMTRKTFCRFCKNDRLLSTNRKLVKRINAVVETMQAEEKKILDHRMMENQQDVARFYTTFLTLLILTVLTIVILFLLINKTLRARLQAEQALSRASEEIKGLIQRGSLRLSFHSMEMERSSK